MVSSPAKSPNLERLFSQRALQVDPQPLVGGMDDVEGKLSFTFGFPDPASLPASEIAEATTRVLASRGRAALQYGDNNGYSGLIRVLLDKLKRDQGIEAGPENILITAGGSQAIALLLDAFVDWGDTICSEMPTWLGAVQAFANVGANVVSIPVDADGTDVAALRVELARLRDRGITPKFVYAISNFQNPTGVTMTLERRQELLKLVQEAGTMLIEDDAYFDLRYAGENLPSIYSLDDSGSVIYMGTFSKTMGPGMRLGWIVAPAEVIQRVAALKVDGGTNVFGAHVAADWLPQGLLPHVGRLRDVYHRRRDIMLAALEAHMPPGVTWTTPDGGFFIWVTLPEGVDTTRMHPQTQELGAEYLPGATCFVDGTGANQLRLSFSFVEDDRIEEGIRIIASVVAGEIQEARN